jgi:hypothetical protein
MQNQRQNPNRTGFKAKKEGFFEAYSRFGEEQS